MIFFLKNIFFFFSVSLSFSLLPQGSFSPGTIQDIVLGKGSVFFLTSYTCERSTCTVMWSKTTGMVMVFEPWTVAKLVNIFCGGITIVIIMSSTHSASITAVTSQQERKVSWQV